MNGLFTSPSIAWGPGALEPLTELGARRVMLVLDPHVAPTVRARRVLEELAKAGAEVRTISDVEIGPSVDSIERMAPSVREARPDWILAVGGGSTIDTAKSLWVRYARPDGPLTEISPLDELGLRRHARFAALPTTCGSGSEVTWTAHLRGPEGRSVELAARELQPDWALLDPTFLETLPVGPKAESAAIAIGHALEAIASSWANPFSDALASRALAAALPGVARLRRHPEEELDGPLQIAACQAGLAVANAQTGLADALARALAADLGVPRGRLVAALLPAVVEFNYPSSRDAYATLAPVFGSGAGTLRTAISDRLRAAWESAGLPRTLAEAGVTTDRLVARIPTIAERVVTVPGALSNPRVPTPGEIDQLLRAAAGGAPVQF